MGQSNSKGNEMKITARDKAILEVKVQRDRMKQYQKKLTIITARETEVAKEQYVLGNKALAVLTLKKRNFQNDLLTKTQEQLYSLDQLVQSIEFAQVEAQVVSGLKTGNLILAQLQKEMRFEDVEKLMDDTAEAIAYQNEISQMLANSTIDESDLLEELEALQLEGRVVKEAEADREIVLPSVPTHRPIIATEVEVEIGINNLNESDDRKELLLEE